VLIGAKHLRKLWYNQANLISGGIPMCAICAAVPAVAALGTAADGEQRKRQKESQARGDQTARPQYPIRVLTALAMLVLFLVSAIYHTYQPSG
jgi:hypothetical protein